MGRDILQEMMLVAKSHESLIIILRNLKVLCAPGREELCEWKLPYSAFLARPGYSENQMIALSFGMETAETQTGIRLE